MKRKSKQRYFLSYRSTARAGARPAWAWPVQRGGWHRRSSAEKRTEKVWSHFSPESNLKQWKSCWKGTKDGRKMRNMRKIRDGMEQNETKWSAWLSHIETLWAWQLQKVSKSYKTASEEHAQNCCRLGGLTDFDTFGIGILQTMPVRMHQRQFKVSFLKAVIEPIHLRTFQDYKRAGINSRRYLHHPSSIVLHTFPCHLHVSAKGISTKAVSACLVAKKRNAACVAFMKISGRSATLCSKKLQHTPHHCRILHVQHKLSACFHCSKELPTASQGVGLAPLLSLQRRSSCQTRSTHLRLSLHWLGQPPESLLACTQSRRNPWSLLNLIWQIDQENETWLSNYVETHFISGLAGLAYNSRWKLARKRRTSGSSIDIVTLAFWELCE